MKKFFLGIFIFFSLLLTFSNPAKADIAVPVYDSSGGLIGVNKVFDITMKEEYVKIELTTDENVDPDFANKLHGTVTAQFVMKNNSTESITIPVIFPAQDTDFYDEIYKGNAVFAFKVGDNPISESTETQILIDGKIFDIQAFQWQESFAPNEEKIINVSYQISNNVNFSRFLVTYILGSGSTWSGPIGKGVVEIIFPENLYEYSYDLWDSKFAGHDVFADYAVNLNPVPYTVEQNKLIFSFNNYEPKNDILSIKVVEPQLVGEAERIKKLPENTANLLALARVYDKMSWGPHAFWFYGKTTPLAIETYKKAISQTQTKEELHSILLTLADYTVSVMDGYKYTYEEITISYLIDLFDPKGCQMNDSGCLYDSSIYLGGFQGEGPFGISLYGDKIEIKNKEILQLIQERATYHDDKELSEALSVFISRIPDAERYYTEMYYPERLATETPTGGQSTIDVALGADLNIIDFIPKATFVILFFFFSGLGILIYSFFKYSKKSSKPEDTEKEMKTKERLEAEQLQLKEK